MEEGLAMWKQKKKEVEEIKLKEQEEVREMANNKLFGRPGNGAPLEDVRKKKFTEYQLDKEQEEETENRHVK